MLHILLLILKIIGIVLLVIIGLILLMVLAGLFVPVRYRVAVSRREGEGEPPVTVSGKITWLLHIANISIRYPSEIIVRVRIFFITLFTVPERKKKEKKRSRKAEGQSAEKTQKSETSEEPEKTEESGEPQGSQKAEEHAADKADKAEVPEETERAEATGADKAETSVETESIETADIKRDEKEEAEPDKLSLFGKIRALWGKFVQFVLKIKSALQNIRYTISNICDKIKSVSDNIQYYKEVMEGDAFKQSVSLCREQLGEVLYGLKPDKFSADFVVGMDDPASTGQILAIYGMLYPFIGNCVNVEGDFDNKRMEGKLYIKGKVRMFTFIRAAVKIYFSKDVKKLIKLLKKEAV